MKDLPDPKDPVELVGQAYERLLESAMDEARQLEDNKSGPALHKLIDKARQKLSDLGELTAEEIDQISEYLKRDLRDAAHYIVETGEDVKTWLGFDLSLLGDRLRDLFVQAADQTTIELKQLQEQAEAAGYHTGEITGPGTLICDGCGEELHFYKPGRIPPCPKCHGTTFHRKPA
ncbi:zinc ribbon-containing protein [Thiolapillus sp.]